MVTLGAFLHGIRENASRINHYELGHDGSGGGCDCIGLIIGALRLAGGSWPSTHGSNWAARNAMSTLEYIEMPVDVFLGEIVYKAKKPGENGYSLPDRYKDSGDLLDYYHVGVVTKVDPLEITHCTSVPGGIQRDSKMGNWRWGGKLKYVDYNEAEETPMEPYKATVHADNDYPVKMRAQPSVNAEILAKIPQGTIVDVIGDSGEWGHILYGGMNGYMMSKFLLPANEGETDEDDGNMTIRRAQLEFIADTLNDLVENIREMIGRG